MTKGEDSEEPYCYTKVDATGYKVDGFYVKCATDCPGDSEYKKWAAKL